jgi:hypothetical protein
VQKIVFAYPPERTTVAFAVTAFISLRILLAWRDTKSADDSQQRQRRVRLTVVNDNVAPATKEDGE